MESLYRKYRPQTFESMVGQKHIVSTLQNALADGRMAHAYLFTGPRGTGKTTTARLLAKALMCEAGGGAPTAHPDGTCEQCAQIAAGIHPDVFELDAASRTGVDNVREEIINRVAFAPVLGAYKVYVIDEVHMLTGAAFNALLKTLEEPPAHVVFVMCTTDPQKIPETVLSRCQRLEFHRISDADIAERLEAVCRSEGFEYEPEALELVARHARGGLRDALSTLETLSVHGRGRVRAEDARAVLGEVADDSLLGMARAVASRDVAACFERVAEMADRGVDVEQYVRDFTRYMRNVYVACVAGKRAFANGDEGDSLSRLAAEFGGPDRLSYLLELLGELQGALRTSTDQRLDFEVALTRMARPQADLTVGALAARVEHLERELAALKAGGVPSAVQASCPTPVAAPPVVQTAPPASSAACDARPPSAPVGVEPAQQPVSAVQANRMPQAPRNAYAPLRTTPEPRTAPEPPRATQQLPQTGRMAPVQASPQPAAPARIPVVAAQQPYPQNARPAAQNARPAAAPAAPGAPDPRWTQIAQLATKMSLSVGALLNNAVGWVDPDGTLVVENRGSSFAAQMLQREKSLQPLRAAAAQVLGREVGVRVVGVGASSAVAAPAPAAVPTPASAPVQSLAPASAAVPAPRPASAPPATVPLSQVPPRREPPAPAPATALVGAPVYEEPACVHDAPAFEFVPDDLYDGYLDESAEVPPDPVPQAAAVDALAGASKNPVAPPPASYAAPWEERPADRPAAAPVQPASAPAQPASAPAQPASAPADDPLASLSELLSAGFGGYVKVTREP